MQSSSIGRGATLAECSAAAPALIPTDGQRRSAQLRAASAAARHRFRIVQRQGALMSTDDEAESQARRVAAAAQREITTFQVPSWLRTVGVGSWLTIGVVALAAVVLCV